PSRRSRRAREARDVKHGRRQRGLTLVEVLVAAVVVGAGLALVASALSSAIRAESHSENLVRISRLLDLQLGRIEGGVLPVQAATGDFSTDGEPDVTWTISVDPTQTANMVQVTIEADWDESGTRQDMEIYRLIYQDPDAAGTGAGASGQ